MAIHCRNVYLEIEPTADGSLLRSIRQIAILVSRLIPEDYAFAGRFGVQQTAFVWALRQFRLFARRCGFNLSTKTASDSGNTP